MAYFAPYIDDSGFHIPSYDDIVQELVDYHKGIYGNDIYLDNDSQDYQQISLFAGYLHDAHLAQVAIYNNRGPQTAIGSGLDGVLKLNGIKRKVASYSTCVVTITGDPGTRIENGICEDQAGIRWLLPDFVEIDSDGSISVSARSEKIGEITALPNTVTKIATPTRGWISVNNQDAAVVGQPIEKDATARARQQQSTMLPSQGLLDGTRGSVQGIQNVSRYRVYENDTNVTDSDGIPEHSICAVVEGGLDEEIANEIYIHKTPGCYTYGDVVVEVMDISGITLPIRFFRPTYKTIDVNIFVKALDGYTSSKSIEIQDSVTQYLHSLNIGEDVINSSAFAAAMIPVVALSKPVYSVIKVELGFEGDPLIVQDLDIDFKSATLSGSITITEVI